MRIRLSLSISQTSLCRHSSAGILGRPLYPSCSSKIGSALQLSLEIPVSLRCPLAVAAKNPSGAPGDSPVQVEGKEKKRSVAILHRILAGGPLGGLLLGVVLGALLQLGDVLVRGAVGLDGLLAVRGELGLPVALARLLLREGVLLVFVVVAVVYGAGGKQGGDGLARRGFGFLGLVFVTYRLTTP